MSLHEGKGERGKGKGTMTWPRQLHEVLLMLVMALITGCRGSGEASAAPPSVRYDAYVSAGGAAPPAGELVNPRKGDAQAATEGARVFVAMNCDGCHGGGATGWVGPSLVDGRWRYGGSDGAVFQSIFYGRPRGMPAYGGILSAGPIWQLVTYLEAQPRPQEVPTQAWR
ncbi:MAG: c-type cytochrome [Gemmatimonadales bacterium]